MYTCLPNARQNPPKFVFNKKTLGQKIDTYMLDDDINLFDIEKMIREHTLSQSDCVVENERETLRSSYGVEMDCLNGNHPRPHSNHASKKEGHAT